MKTYTEEIEIEPYCTEHGFMVAVATVEAHEVDASFSHEFGVTKDKSIKVDNVLIEEILDEDGGFLIVDKDMLEEIKELASAVFVAKWQDGNL